MMSAQQLRQAQKLWELGLDTFDIADVLELSEATVLAEFRPGIAEDRVAA